MHFTNPAKRIANIVYFAFMILLFGYAIITNGEFSQRINETIVFVYSTEFFASILFVLKNQKSRDNTLVSLIVVVVGLAFFVIFGFALGTFLPAAYFGIRSLLQLAEPARLYDRRPSIVRILALIGAPILTLTIIGGNVSEKTGVLTMSFYYLILLVDQVVLFRKETNASVSH